MRELLRQTSLRRRKSTTNIVSSNDAANTAETKAVEEGFESKPTQKSVDLGAANSSVENESISGYLSVGDVVWARLSSRAPWWPAAVIDPRLCGYDMNDRVWVFWLGDSRISDVDKTMVRSLAENFALCYRHSGSQNYVSSVRKAIELYAKRMDRVVVGDDPVEWAINNLNSFRCNHKMKTIEVVKYDDCLQPNCDESLPDFIVKRLYEIRELQESKLSGESSDESENEMDDNRPPKLCRLDEDENSDTSNDSNIFAADKPASHIEYLQHREQRHAIVLQKSLSEFCLCCGGTTELTCDHPMFEGKLCSNCLKWYKEVCFIYDQDNKKENCSICAGGGDLIICDNAECTNVFCKDCLATLDSEKNLTKILKTDPWWCYLCTDKPANLLRPKRNWSSNVFGLFSNSNVLDDIDLSLVPEEKQPIRVLSLFDGVGTGLVVLKELGLDVEVYYCSEIDPEAALVSRVNHTRLLHHLGDVRSVDLEKLKQISPIDLLIGGSPCNDISIANPKRRGLYDPEGTGILFFEFYRIMQSLLQINGREGRNLFWLFENVASMREQYRSVIDRFLGKPPAPYDSRHFSAQNRARYFWGNIPGMYNATCPSNCDRSPVIDDILTPNCGRVGMMDKVRTVTTRTNSMKQGRTFSVFPVSMDGKPDILWPRELEKLFGLPLHYTDVGNLSPAKRQKLIGQGWTVPVVGHIMRPLLRFYKTKEQK